MSQNSNQDVRARGSNGTPGNRVGMASGARLLQCFCNAPMSSCDGIMRIGMKRRLCRWETQDSRNHSGSRRSIVVSARRTIAKGAIFDVPYSRNGMYSTELVAMHSLVESL